MRRRVRRLAATFALCLPSLASPVGSALAQDAALVRVEQLMSDGRFPSAREELQTWIDTDWNGAGRDDRQRGLWLRGRLTVDAGMAELDFRRLVVEYPGGAFSDGALLRLAELAGARSDVTGARRHLQMLMRDYPESEHRAEAINLMARLEEGAAGPADVGRADIVPSAAPVAPPAVPPAVAPTPPPGAANRPGVGAGPGQPPGQVAGQVAFDGMPFTIEMGAFSTEPPALTIANAATAAGVAVRLVGLQGSDLIHVRTGAFFSQMEAEARALALRLQGLPASVLPDREEEEPR